MNQKLYCKYVDHILILFFNEENAKLINLHEDLLLTVESEFSNHLHFLDINIKLKESRITTTIHIKPSNTENFSYIYLLHLKTKK